MDVQRVASRERFVTRGTNVRLAHILDHHLVLVQKLGNAGHGRVCYVFQSGNVRENFLLAHVEIGFAQFCILLKKRGNVRKDETIVIPR